jgi:serine/threonine protein kinase
VKDGTHKVVDDNGSQGEAEMGESARSIESQLEGAEPRAFGRYVLYAPIARGGMATVHIARLVGADGFNRIVAAKRLHPQFTEDPDFVAMFRDEAEIASKIHHPNVVPVLDIVLDGEEVILVQEYVHGVPLDRLYRAASMAREAIPTRIVVGIVAGVLAGLHSAHEATDERGEPLGIIHRDVSPQNVMVSIEGIPRLLDFGIAKASSSSHVTRAGLLKGKVAYMASEQIRGGEVTRAADIYACGVMLWELLALRRLHAGRGEAEILSAVVGGDLQTLSSALEPIRPSMSKERWDQIKRIEPIVTKALSNDPKERYQTAAEMMSELLDVAQAASALDIAEWVKARGAEYLERRQQVLASNEESWRSLSRIAAATATGGPISGVTRVRREAGVLLADGPTTAPDAASAMFVNPMPAAPSRARFVPWAVAGVSLLAASALFGMQIARRAPIAETEAASHVREPTAVVAAPAPAQVEGAESSAIPTTNVSALPVAKPARPVVVYAAPVRRAAAVEAPAPPPVHVAPVVAPTPVVPAPVGAPSPKADCDPPFYFDGAKKVFKTNCI